MKKKLGRALTFGKSKPPTVEECKRRLQEVETDYINTRAKLHQQMITQHQVGHDPEALHYWRDRKEYIESTCLRQALNGLAYANELYAKSLEPDAAKGAAQRNQCRKNAPEGGKARAHYTHTQITDAFAGYKRRNPDKSAWDAAHALIRKGNVLDKYKTVTGPWNIIKRLANDGDGITVNEWYGCLK